MSDSNLARLLEVIEALRKETVRKLGEIESRVDERAASRRKELADLMELVYTLSDAIALTYHLELLMEVKKGSLREIESGLTRVLEAWKDAVIRIQNVFGVVDWTMLQGKSKLILRIAKRSGLPFQRVAREIVEVMGSNAIKFLREETVSEIYGPVSLNLWKRLALDIKGSSELKHR